jgi:hypothetical protein
MLVENATSPWGQSWERVFYDKEHLALQFLKLDHFLEIIKGKKWWHYFDHQR